jgi:methionyl-tRNA synthetase
MLLAAGVPLPKVVYAHGWWQVAGRKMSKTLKNVVSVSQAIQPFGRDAFRFYMLRAAPVGADGDFTWENLRERYEKDLANELGNLLNRTLAMIEKNLDGVIPVASDAYAPSEALRKQAAALDVSLDEPYARVDITEVLDRIWLVIRAANRFVDDAKPWELKKQGDAGRPQLESVLGVLADTLLHVARALAPVIPDSAPKITLQLGLGDEWLALGTLSKGDAIPAGTRVAKGDPIFPKVEDPKYPLDLHAAV